MKYYTKLNFNLKAILMGVILLLSLGYTQEVYAQDADGDGIADVDDLDDNDGILDIDEGCTSSLGPIVVNTGQVKLLSTI